MNFILYGEFILSTNNVSLRNFLVANIGGTVQVSSPPPSVVDDILFSLHK